MSISLVQQIQFSPGSQTNTITLTLPSAPTVGNVLIAACAYSQYANARTIGTPSGWTKWDDFSDTNSDSLACFWHVVQAGDGTTYSFPITGASTDWCNAILLEWSGVDTTAPINQHSIVAGTSSYVATPVTPSVLSTQPLILITNGQAGGPYIASVTPGSWTNTTYGGSNYHGAYGAYSNSLTTDTTTPIAPTANMSASSGGIIELVLLAPTGSGAITGTASVASKKASISASGTATAPTFTGTASVASRKATISASGTATAPTFTGTASVASRKATISASGTATAPSFTGTASVASKKATISASGTFAPVITGSAAVASRKAAVSIYATFTPSGYTAGNLTLALLGVGS
jgi:hypothetical protein